ncbi:MAG TPA: AMP-binding protein [Acidimicrobiales bacterium]|nr:AMP-binding protein [Acidimicrobiales bacterium]
MQAARRRLRPTLVHTKARHYRRPGGPWRVGTLDALLSDPPTAVHHHRVVDGDRRLGDTELAEAVNQLAGRLRRAGVRRGDAVAWQLPNGLAAVLLFRACWRLGAVAVPIHPAAGGADLAASLAQVTPQLVLASIGSAASELPGAVTVADGAGDPFADLLPAAPVAGPASTASPADLALAIFTSGSSGRAKGVLHTQRGLAYKARSLARAHGLAAGDVVLAPAPMSHISGLLSGVLLPAAVGMTSVSMARWDPDRAVGLVEQERVTFMAGPPTFFVTLTAASGFRPDKVSSVRLVSAGGAAVTPAFVDETTDSLGCLVKRTYGSSEAPMVATSVPGDDPRMARDTDGRAVGDAELMVVDQHGKACPSGRAGELWVRGPELFVGYADAADNEGARARGGWFRTGDLATLEGEGWLQVVGRLKEVIIRGGENVSSAEVERALEAHPHVDQAVVVPYPDAVMGERVGAVVVAPPSFDAVACGRWLAAQGLARHKVPERLVHVPALPMLASGKADRARVRELVEAASPPDRSDRP